jgi:hypothetical protein
MFVGLETKLRFVLQTKLKIISKTLFYPLRIQFSAAGDIVHTFSTTFQIIMEVNIKITIFWNVTQDQFFHPEDTGSRYYETLVRILNITSQTIVFSSSFSIEFVFYTNEKSRTPSFPTILPSPFFAFPFTF